MGAGKGSSPRVAFHGRRSPRQSNKREVVAFAAPYPGRSSTAPRRAGGELICQKDSFLCAAKGVQVGIAFQKRSASACSAARVNHATDAGRRGRARPRRRHDHGARAPPGEQLKLATGCLVALHPTVQYDVQLAGGIKNSLFGGEGLSSRL